MALRVGLAMALMAVLWTGATAQMGCMSAIIGLSPCLNYITGSSPTPSSSCCTQLASVVSSQAQCLCTVLNGGASSLGITINQTQALALPGACNVQTPPASQCNATSGPPADSPAVDSSAKSAPPASSAPSTALSTKSSTPFGVGQISDASFMAVPPALIVFLAFITVALAITFY